MATFKQGCRVKSCEYNHNEHVCRLCEENDTDHFSSECPKSETLYHGSPFKYMKPISVEGLKESTDGRLGPGVYFVDEYDHAKSISKNRFGKNAADNPPVVIECQVYLGKHLNLGKRVDEDWHKEYDSASTIHPPWPNVLEIDFKEYCLKDSRCCVMKTLYMDDVPIKKDANMTWGEAQHVINLLGPKPTPENFEEAMKKLKQIYHTSQNELNEQQPRDKHDLQKAVRDKKRPFAVALPQIQTPNRGFKISDFKELLRRWYLVVKTLLTLFFIVNSIWSAIHLNKQDDRNVAAVVSFIVFVCLQSIANIVLLIGHGFDSNDEPHKINKIITLSKFLIALCLEMPMVVSQAFVIKSIKQWNDFSWDVAIQFQFIFNLLLFTAIDLIYLLIDNVYKMWIPGAIFLSTLISGSVFTPVHLVQFGLRWQPDENTSNLLSFSMFFGAFGLWTWPVSFPISCWFVFEMINGKFSFERLYKRWYLLLKAFLIQFNIWNGIWSLVHLYSESNDNIESALRSFAVFFTLQSLANLIYLIFHAKYAFKDHRMTDKWQKMMITKTVIAFVLEMPMLTSQAYAMRNMDNLVWSDLNWDVGMQLQFIINTTLFVGIDLYHDDKLTAWLSLAVLFLIVPAFFTPVYLALVGWKWTPNSLNYFGGVVGDNENGIVGLLYISMGIGVTGLWIWTIGLAILAIGLARAVYKVESRKWCRCYRNLWYAIRLVNIILLNFCYWCLLYNKTKKCGKAL